jgi:large subunit ribosomal protein L24
MKAKILKNDKILVTAGKDKGKTGEVLRVFRAQNKVIVSGINIVKKTTKANKKNPQGGIIELAKPLDISNVAFVCPNCGKSSRIGISITKDGQKERICKKCKGVVKE